MSENFFAKKYGLEEPQNTDTDGEENFFAKKYGLKNYTENKEPRKQQEQGNFNRGFETAMRQVPQTIGGVIGLAGDAVGSDSVKDYGMNIYNNQSKKIQDISKNSDSFTNVLNGDASLGDWATYGTGYVGGQALQAVATGGLGAFVGKKVAQAGLNKALKEGVEHQISEEAKKQTLSKAMNRGATVGMFGSNAVQEVGSIYPEALHEAEKDGRTLDGGDLARVAGSGLVAAGIDTVTDMSVLKGVLGGGSSASNIFKRAAKTIPTAMAKEGATEGVQTGIERWGAQQDLSSEDAIRDYVDSAALGVLGGGFAGAGGAIRQVGKNEQQNAIAQSEQSQNDTQIQYDNGLDFTSTTPNQLEQTEAPQQQIHENEINFESPTPASDSWALGESQPDQVDHGNTINYEHPALNTNEIETGSVPDYVFPTQQQTPSQQLGINPADGHMSTAAALAVDGGVTSSFNMASEAESANNTQRNDNEPLNKAAELATNSYTDSTAQAIQHGMSEIAKGAQEAALENTIQRLEKDGEVTLYKKDSIAQALGDDNYNVRQNEDGSASIIGVRNPATNVWHGQGKTETGQIEQLADNVIQQQENVNKNSSKSDVNTDAYDDVAAPDTVNNVSENVSRLTEREQQINQLKSQQADIGATTPITPDQIHTEYGDTAESVMSDIEILGDDFTVDLRDERKKANALNNPNYNAVQKADGSVEIVGMKHPSTGEWVGEKPTRVSIDENAHQAATSSQNNTPEPTQAQIEAGNYKKGHIKVQGLDISIENPKGSERRGTDPDGKEWSHQMSDHYGYIKGTTGADNEHIDTYVGNNPESDQVFVVDQLDQQSDGFDEHKVMLGFNSQEEATTAYKSNFDQGWKVGPIRKMNMEEFKDWIKKGDTSKPSSPKNFKNGLEKIRAEKTRRQKNVKVTIQSDAEIGQTHSIPAVLMDAPHRLGDVVDELAAMRTNGTKGNVHYAIKLLRNIARLNPDVQVHIVSDLGKIEDKSIRAGLVDGGFFVPGQNTAYIYPKSEAWNSSVLELLNHELVHSVTEQSISNGLISKENLNKLQEIRGLLEKYIPENTKTLSEDIKDRLYYAYNDEYFNELLAVGISESNVREVLKKALGIESFRQLDSIFTEIATNQHKGYSNEQKQSRDTQGQQSNGIKKISSPTPGEAGNNINSPTNVSGSQDVGRGVGDLAQDSESLNKKKSIDDSNDSPLYSRKQTDTSGVTAKHVRDILVKRFGEKTIASLEKQGKLKIIDDFHVEGVEGFYHNNQSVLVASNLTADSVIPTFLHELGGHAGFQNMMNQDAYAELMRQFDKLVEQGNPIAMAAKVLAEREQGKDRQQLEYLPYLLTLSSTMQQRNVVQRNALQKLINNIVSYVKAWAFDNFGINLNLNPDDILVLSERMVNQLKEQSSLDVVRQKYHGTSQWMTAPNGAKTHLSELQWLQVRTPEFKKWFGDWENDAANASQILDDNGEPKVVYHGTATEFNEFKQGHGLLGDGIYLTDSFDTADMYANIRGNQQGFVLPLFVNIRNALKTTGNVSRDKVVDATRSGMYQGVVHQFEGQEYIVAQQSNQVKMAEGNAGTFNSESGDIWFSRSASDITDRLSENIKNLYSSKMKLPSMADAMKYGLMFLSRMQITDIYKKLLPQLSVYNDLVRQMDADKNDIAAEADNIVREWAKLKDEEALANLMHEATLAQIDPAKPHQPGDDKVKYQQLLKTYNNLSPEAQAMYKTARNAYSKHYAKIREAVRERILRSALSSEKKADLLQKIEGSFGQIKGVYFPLARFGKYVVIVKNQNGNVESVSRAETENEANALHAELIRKYPDFKVEDVIRDQEYSALRDKVGRGFMSDLFDEVGNLGLDAKKQAEFEDTLGQLYLSSMPDLSWAKHGMHRKGTAGFSNNARRAFAQNMSSGAGYLAKLRYSDQLVAQLDEMEEYAKDQIKKDPNYKQPLASAVIDEMNKRHENLMNAKGNALSSLLTSMGFVYFLGLSPAAAMVNILQTPLVAYPIMGAKFGFDKAGIALLKASKDYANGVGFKMPDFTDLESFRKSIGDSVDPDIAKVLKDHEKQAYDKAVSAGVIDVTQAHDLAGVAQGEDSEVMLKIRPIMRGASLMFHHAERFNREVTFIAAYRLSKESGMTDTDAYKQAVKMTYDGHFDYSASNRARFMQGNVAKVVFLFKQFGQNMIYTVARQTYQSIKGATQAERLEARRAISGILVTHAMAAGVLGLPLVTTILAIASGLAGMFGGGDDDPWDAEVALRNSLADMTSPTFSNLVMKGLSRGTPADISGRVGLDSMFLARAPDGLEGQKLYEQIILGNMGATVGMGANIAKGIQELGDGNYRRALEEMLPTFAKNPFKAYRYAVDGVQDKTGIDILDGHPVSGVGLFSQTIGFSPSQVRTAYEGKSAIYQQQQALQKRRSKLTSTWVRAKRNDDQEGMDLAWKDIQEFNEVNPKLRINRINLMQSYHQNAKRLRDAENGVYLSKKYSDLGEYGRFADTD